MVYGRYIKYLLWYVNQLITVKQNTMTWSEKSFVWILQNSVFPNGEGKEITLNKASIIVQVISPDKYINHTSQLTESSPFMANKNGGCTINK